MTSTSSDALSLSEIPQEHGNSELLSTSVEPGTTSPDLQRTQQPALPNDPQSPSPPEDEEQDLPPPYTPGAIHPPPYSAVTLTCPLILHQHEPGVFVPTDPGQSRNDLLAGDLLRTTHSTLTLPQTATYRDALTTILDIMSQQRALRRHPAPSPTHRLFGRMALKVPGQRRRLLSWEQWEQARERMRMEGADCTVEYLFAVLRREGSFRQWYWEARRSEAERRERERSAVRLFEEVVCLGERKV